MRMVGSPAIYAGDVTHNIQLRAAKGRLSRWRLLTKNGIMKKLIYLFLIAFCTPSFPQFNLQSDMDAKMNAVVEKLRNSIIEHRRLYTISCRLNKEKDCDIAALDEAQIILLDIETKYRIKAKLAQDSDSAAKDKNIQQTASDIRSLIDDFASNIGKRD